METKERTKPRQTCTWHCAGCDSHFHSVSAFEAHRQDGACVPPIEARRRVGKRSGETLLQAWTEDGWCSLQTGCKKDGVVVNWLHPVTIYQREGEKWQGPTS